MLEVTIPKMELFNEYTSEFIYIDEQKLTLEHSLLSISKWESKWEKPFININGELSLTPEELIDYVRCMTINKNVDPQVYEFIPLEVMNEIADYINRPCTATTINHPDTKKKSNAEGITSELIYYWMVAYNIPHEYERWHLNRLLTLIEICNVKNQPEKKMSKKAEVDQRRALNEARRKKLHSKG